MLVGVVQEITTLFVEISVFTPVGATGTNAHNIYRLADKSEIPNAFLD